MNIMIVGAGVIGTIYGWALSEAGHSVTHLVRPGRALRLGSGISIDMLDRRKGHKKWHTGTYNIRVTETISPADNYEMVIVPVRHYALEDALRQIVPQAPDADYLLLTQNWKGIAGIDNILEQSKYIFGDAKAGGSLKDNKLTATIYAVDIGPVGNKQNSLLEKARNLFQSADIKTTVRDNMLHYLWVQYAVSGGMWPALVRAGSLQAVLRDKNLVKASFLGAKECLSVAAARGVELDKYPETGIYFTSSAIKRAIGVIAMKIMFSFSKYIRRNSAHALADPKEIKAFYYDLINSGAELGISMPVMLGFKKDIDNL